ncbi:MAG: AmmeMemoRadiSam system protein A [Thermodesulfovibrio sp.]|nr:AmmeMemoRadiSam system protein A [Thermodesulfovibrio sp.]
MHPYVEIAKKTIEEFVKTGKIASIPKEIPEGMKKKAGVFVSIKKRGQLRGCIGTFMPATENIYSEIIRNAIAAATEDPRFPPVHENELTDLEYSVDILSPPEPVRNLDELDPKKYGIIVIKGWQKGLLLPDIEGVNTVDEQLRIAKLKAGIDPFDPDVEIYKFKVERYK